MEDPHALRDSAIRCRNAFRQCLYIPSLNDESWTENRLGDFNLWLTNLRVFNPGHASLDYRLRDREDLRNVIEGLLRSLHEFVERCRVPEEPTTADESVHEVQGSDGSVSSWSDLSDEENGPSKTKQVSASTLSDPISGVESTLDRLIRLGVVIRKSGDRFRHEMADHSLEVSNYEEFRKHLEFILFKEQESGKEPEDASQQVSGNISGKAITSFDRQKRFEQFRLTDFQQRAIDANIIRRNRFDFAKKRELKANPRPQPKLTEQQPRIQKPIVPAPALTPQFKDLKAENKVSLSRPTVVETATQLGTITMPVEPTPSKAVTTTTKISSTGQKLDYPRCPQLKNPDDASFQCPLCCQQLPKKYLEKSGWRSHVHRDIIPYICIFEDCNPKSFFASKEEWTQHLRATHSKKYWQCPFPEICKDTLGSKFSNESDWIDHMTTHQSADNQTKFSAAQLRMIAGTNVIHDFSIESCPLCYFSSPMNGEKTISHIAEHLHSFALRSLPWESGADEDQSAVTQSMDGKASSEFSDHGHASSKSQHKTATTSENPDQFDQVIAGWQDNLFTKSIPPSYKAKIEQVRNAARRLYSQASGDKSPIDWDAIRRMEAGLLDISWIIEQLEEVITPSGDLLHESMSERRDDLDEEFEDLVSALIPLKARAYDSYNIVPGQEEIEATTGHEVSSFDLWEFAGKLQLRPEIKKEVELNLMDLGREIIYRGDLYRRETDAGFFVDTHAILFDHYFVLANILIPKDLSQSANTSLLQQTSRTRPQNKTSNAEPRTPLFDLDRLRKMAPFPNTNINGPIDLDTPYEMFPHAKQQATKEIIRPYERYDVSKLPIPMDLLVLESTEDDPVLKSSIRNVATVAPQGDARESGPSTTSSAAVPENKEDEVLFPFKIKHLGKAGTHTLYAFSARDRIDWCRMIIEAKTKHAATLSAQNLEPFRLRVLADTAFACVDYPSVSKNITIEHTPLRHAIKEVEKEYGGSGPRPPPICRTTANCATAFQQGRQMCAVGTDYGLYISELSNPRGWYRAIPLMRVTQVAVFEEFNMLLLIADQSLLAYQLDIVCSAGKKGPGRPHKLGRKYKIGFFAAGLIKNRYLVVYKRTDGSSSTFEVIEPVLQESKSDKSYSFQSRRSRVEFFREFDNFYIPAESYSINMFKSSLAISTRRGIEVVTLDKKHSWSVPDFSANEPHAHAHETLMSMARRIENLRSLGMFRVSEDEFLVAYQQCALYVNKHGDVSRSVVVEFLGSAHTACLYRNFLILFNDDFVEIRDAMNGGLRQVIPGHNVVCLDVGSDRAGFFDPDSSTQHTVKICMRHPDFVMSHLVLELVENPDFIS